MLRAVPAGYVGIGPPLKTKREGKKGPTAEKGGGEGGREVAQLPDT